MKRLTPDLRIAIMTVAMLLVAAVGISQSSYFSISDGDWSSTEVWSTDGVTPCACVPPTNVNGIEVTIMHEVTSGSNLHVKGGGTLTISETGQLLMPDKELNVQDGSFISDGFAHLGGLVVGNAGYVLITAPGVVEDKFLVNGTIDVMFDAYDTLKVMAADVHINPGSEFNAMNTCVTVYDGDFDNSGMSGFDNASICSYEGDIVNKGALSFSTNTCATGGGDFVNMGTVSGTGAVTMAGMVDNSQGDWSDIFWCGLGGEDMPMEMDCDCTDSICALTGQDIPLAIQSVSIELKAMSGNVEINWSFTGDADVESYCIERAGGDYAFTSIHCGIITPDGYSNVWTYEDRAPLAGRAYYRVLVTETNGTVMSSPVDAIDIARTASIDMHIFPNPANRSAFNVVLFGDEDVINGKLTLFDQSGKMIHSDIVAQQPGVSFEVDLPTEVSGTYIVRFSDDHVNVQKALLVMCN